MIEDEARAYTGYLATPEHGINAARHIGTIQWITGPNIRLVDEPGMRAAVVELRAKGGKESFYFRIIWLGEELDTFTQRGIDNAILNCFKKLCDNWKVKMAHEEPFKKDLEDPVQVERLIRTFETAFLQLDNAPRKN